MSSKNTLSDYTEAEFLKFVSKICSAEFSSENEANDAVREFVRLSEHPDGSDILFYPSPEQDDTPEGVVKEIKEWRAQQGLPGFKSE